MTWGLVPAKGFDHAKSRLAPALPAPARTAFARRLFDHVLGALVASGVLDGILVATESADVADAARAHGAVPLNDPPDARTLAEIVDAGLAELASRGARAALVLMADLPAITPDDVRALVAPLADHDVVLVRAIDGHHTNALALSPPTCLRTSFGRSDSFEAHLASARAAALRVAVLDHARIALDVDTPADHARLR